jgi:predicted O-methyltransferase YrrM
VIVHLRLFSPFRATKAILFAVPPQNSTLAYAVVSCASVLGILAFAVILFLDLRRRRLEPAKLIRRPVLEILDLLPSSLTGACGLFPIIALYPEARATGMLSLRSPAVVGAALCVIALPIFWSEGKKQLQFQRPVGLIFAEGLFFCGAANLIILFLAHPEATRSHSITFLVSAATMLLSFGMIALIVPPFMRRYEGLRILDRIAEDEQSVQPEYTPATPECPNPELWSMLDSQTTEVEVLDFLKTIVTTIKPRLVVETGTFLGHGTVKLAEGVKENGFGRVITVEFDPEIRSRALRRFDASGLSPWIESRLESSLDTVIDGEIDLLYSDSHLANREAEIRRLLPQLNPRGLLIIHDASSHFKIVREAVLRLEAEGLISAVLLSTPRGVVVAQRREVCV